MDGEFYGREPHDAYAWMRAHAPVYYDEANDLWAAASYAAVKAASVDTEALLERAGHPAQVPAAADDDRLRRPRARAPAPAGLRGLHPQAGPGHGGPAPRRPATPSSTRCARRGSCDFVADIAAPLPIAVIGDMLGVAPADRAELLEWSDVMLKSQGSPDPEAMVGAMHAFEGYTDYINPVLADRKATGSTADLVGVLCQAEIDGDSLDEASLIHETLLILIGGDETTRHVISGGMEELLAQPDQLARLAADPEGPDARCGRGDAALGVADQEHGPHGDPRRRARRRHHQGGPGAPAPLPVGQPGRDGLRRRRHLRHHAQPQPAHRLRLRRPLLPRQPAGPPGAQGHVRAPAGPHARPPPGRRSATRCPGVRPTSFRASRPCRSQFTPSAPLGTRAGAA